MSHDPGTIRPRRRQRAGVAESVAAVRAERSTRVLIRMPLACADQTLAAASATRRKASPTSAVTTAHKSSPDSIIAASNTTIQTEQGSTAPGVRHSTAAGASEGPQDLVSSLPLETKLYRRFDAAHAAAAAPHSVVPTGLERRTAALIKLLERKSLLAIGLIVAAAAIAGVVMTLTNRSHPNAAESGKIQSEKSFAHPTKEVNQHPSLPAPPRATSSIGSPITQPAANSPMGKGPELSLPGTPPGNSGLPTAVLGTTLDNSSASAHGWNTAAANSPAAIVSPTNSSIAVTGATHSAAANNQPPVMADYRWPQPAVQRGDLGPIQSGCGSAATSAVTAPILEARRENISAATPGNSRLGGPSATAVFDGGIGKSFEQTPR